MNSFYEHHRDSIHWHYRCFDRIPRGDLNSIASISASSMISTPSSELLASKPRDSVLKREQNSR